MTSDAAEQVETAPLLALVARLGARWGVADLDQRVAIVFSRRLTSSLGHCRALEGRLTIADRLRSGPAELLEEVVAHEAAHAAAYFLHGPLPRPHGPVWRSLMRQAGYPARRALEVPPELRPPPRRKRYVWEHRCPVCATSRDAGRPVYEWRCAPCWRAGRSGHLHISRLPANG